MTDHEKAVVMAYTGIAMLVGDKLNVFYKYIAEKLGRPVYSHELADDEILDQIKRASFTDFKEICRENGEEKHGHWEDVERNEDTMLRRCSVCNDMQMHWDSYYPNYCPNCGARMNGGNDERVT